MPKSIRQDPTRTRKSRQHLGRPQRLDWAALMLRVYALDVLLCPRCGGRMQIIAVLPRTADSQAILRACGLAIEPPARGLARPLRKRTNRPLPYLQPTG